MVARAAARGLATLSALGVPLLLGAGPERGAGERVPGIEKLDPVTRTRVLLGLLAIILLGIGLLAMVVLAARMVRRWARYSPPRMVSTPLPPKPKRAEPLPDDEETTDGDPASEHSD